MLYRVTWTNARDQGDTVRGATGLTGTQTKPLTLPNVPPIPATGKRFSVTFPNTIVTWRGDKIAAIDLGQPSTHSISEQLGVQPPA